MFKYFCQFSMSTQNLIKSQIKATAVDLLTDLSRMIGLDISEFNEYQISHANQIVEENIRKEFE